MCHGVTPRAAPRHLRNVEGSDAEVFEKYAEELTRFAAGIVAPSDAQDVVSGAFLRCMTSRGWRDVQDRRAYLYRSVLNEARSHHRSVARRLQRESRAAEREGVGRGTPQPEVLQAVQRLSLRQRAVVFLTYWEDLGPASVAELLGISEGAVRRHLARARARLKEVLDGQH